MILPTNGKVVVFDDEYDEVKGLLKALSKQGIPYNYYQDETGEDLPEEPIKNVRLVFLDLQLITGQSMSNHAIISSIGARLGKVIEPSNNYILVYWSTKETKYKDTIDAAFEDRLKDYKPIIKISLNKIEARKKGDEVVNYIIQEIQNKSEDFSLFKVFSLWENLVNNSAGKLVNDFTHFIGKDCDWDDSAKYVLYKLAQAYSGKQIENKSELEQVEDAFFTLNYTLLDSIENSINSKLNEHSENLKNVISGNYTPSNPYNSIINKKLLLSQNGFEALVPGSLFLIDEELSSKEKYLKQKFEDKCNNPKIPENKKDSIVKKLQKALNDDLSGVEFQRKAINKNFNILVSSIIKPDVEGERAKILNDIIESSIKIEINISPLCDYAQRKMHCCRFLPGLFIPLNLFKNINTKNAYNYISDGVIRFEGDIDYKLVFDFRFLYSRPEKLIKNRNANYKVRHQLLSDIQLKLGTHINRPGVLYVP